MALYKRCVTPVPLTENTVHRLSSTRAAADHGIRLLCATNKQDVTPVSLSYTGGVSLLFLCLVLILTDISL